MYCVIDGGQVLTMLKRRSSLRDMVFFAPRKLGEMHQNMLKEIRFVSSVFVIISLCSATY